MKKRQRVAVVAAVAVLLCGGVALALWRGTADGPWTAGNASAAAADQSGSKPGDKPGSKPGGKPGDKPGCKPGERPEALLEFLPRELVKPARAPMPERLEFSGLLVAPATAVLRAKGAGTLLALQVAEGDRVLAGQVVGRIDLADQASRAVERDASVEVARTALAQAERMHDSNAGLAAQQFISAVALDNSRAAVETARAQLAAAQASLQTTRLGLRDATLSAPIAGIVARRHVLPGEKVAPEQAVLTLVDLSMLELAGNVGTHLVSRLLPGMPVQVSVEGSEQPVAGRIARIAPAAEAGTRSIAVTISLANPRRCAAVAAGAAERLAACSESFRAGQYALASVLLPDTQPRLTVPLTAIARSGGQDHVWLIADGALARRPVTLGRRDEAGGRVEVLEGVQDRATLLAVRFDNLREGAKAQVVAARAAAVASGSAPAPAALR